MLDPWDWETAYAKSQLKKAEPQPQPRPTSYYLRRTSSPTPSPTITRRILSGGSRSSPSRPTSTSSTPSPTIRTRLLGSTEVQSSAKPTSELAESPEVRKHAGKQEDYGKPVTSDTTQTISREELNNMIKDLPEPTREKVKKAADEGATIKVYSGEAPGVNPLSVSPVKDIVRKEERKLAEKSSVYAAGEKIKGAGVQAGEKVTEVLPLEKVPGGSIVEEFAAGIIQAPFKGIGSMVQSAGAYELLLKGEKITPLQGKIIGERYEEAHQLQMESFAMEGVAQIARVTGGKAIEFVRFRGKEYIPPEKVIKPEVLLGKETFPSPLKQDALSLIGEFRTSPYTHAIESEVGPVRGFHATSVAGGAKGISRGFEVHSEVARPGDVPGLYVAPSISPHFLKVGGEAVEYTLFPRNPFKRPGVLLTGFKDVERLPPDVRRNIPKAQEFMRTQAEKGKAYVTPEFEMGKPEAEAVLTPETPVRNVRGSGLLGGKFKYYTEWEGKKIPIYEMQAEIGTKLEKGGKIQRFGSKSETKSELRTVKEIIKEYSYRGERRAIYSPEKYVVDLRSNPDLGSGLGSDLASFTESSFEVLSQGRYPSPMVSTPSKIHPTPSGSSTSGIFERGSDIGSGGNGSEGGGKSIISKISEISEVSKVSEVSSPSSRITTSIISEIFRGRNPSLVKLSLRQKQIKVVLPDVGVKYRVMRNVYGDIFTPIKFDLKIEV